MSGTRLASGGYDPWRAREVCVSGSNRQTKDSRARRASLDGSCVVPSALVRSLIGALAMAIGIAAGQAVEFTIRWSEVGEVAATQGQARAGRKLFEPAELAQFSREKITIARVDVEPTVVPLSVGERFCMTSLRAQAFTETRQPVIGAPLSVSVQEDHLDALAVDRRARDICFQPTSAGEFPVRLTSLFAARDGTTRGAQIFLRVQGAAPETERTKATEQVK